MGAIRKDPGRPLMLVCNAEKVWTYQDPGRGLDTPESPEFHQKRDLEILYRLNLFPGAILPARILFHRLWDQIENLEGLCVFSSETAPAWTGWPRTRVAAYRRGWQRGVAVLLRPRPVGELRREKHLSVAVVERSGVVAVRPHILLCSVCQYGAGVRPPYPEDNLPELIQRMLRDPTLQLRQVPHADWMMCAPFPYRHTAINACVNNKGSGGLPNQLRDLRVLQILGLTYGALHLARALYRQLLERVPGTRAICRIEHGRPSVWWTGCGALPKDNPNYRRGRKALLKQLDRADKALEKTALPR